MSGSPLPSSHDHAVGDTKKSLHIDILNLIAILLDHLRVSIENASEVKVYSLQVVGKYPKCHFLNKYKLINYLVF